MKLFFNPDFISKTIEDIKRKLRKLMNGEVSGAMSNMGSQYRVNYGVEYLRLKNLANSYSPNSDLANRLWALNIRETMILATLLQPSEEFSMERAESWVERVNQPELAEQLCMNLLIKVPYRKRVVMEWINSDNVWKQITGFTLLSRIYREINYEDVKLILNSANRLLNEDYFHLYKSIGMGLSRICRISDEIAEIMREYVVNLEFSTKISEKYVYEEITTELIFFVDIT